MLDRRLHRAAYERFLKRLLNARLEAKLTQQQVADQLGKPQSFVAKIEAGERRVDFVDLQVLARVYGKPLEYFRDKRLS